MIKKWIASLAVCAIALFMGCKNELDETEPVAVENVTIDKNAIILTPKSMDKLKATITPRNADDKTVTWSSSNDEVVVVSDGGMVTAVNEGKAAIIAQAGDKTAICVVTVCVHSYSVDRCTKCGFSIDGTIDENAVLTEYHGDEETVIIPDGVTEIGEKAFWGCTNLKTIIIPTSVIKICDTAFRDCKSIENVNYGGTTTQWYAMDIDSYLMSYAKFIIMNDGTDFKGITEFVIPDGVKTVKDYAFYGCRSLKSVTIPNSVTNIGDAAFMYCDSLTSIGIPDSVTSIGNKAFGHSLVTVNYGGTSSQWCAMDSDGSLMLHAEHVIMNDGTDFKDITEFVIPNGVKSIGNSTFYSCTNLERVTIPDSVTSIGDGAFSGCSSLTSVTIPDSVTSIGDNAFSGCTNLASVTMGNGVMNIGNRTFSGCTSLASMTIPNSVTSIDGGAFEMCTSLTSVNIPSNVTTIINATFKGCKSLTSVTIPNGVTSIYSFAFDECTSLASVTIPTSMHIIYDAFYGCDKLETVYYEGTKENWEHMSILGNSGLSGKTIHGKDDDGNDTTWTCD